MIHTPPQHQTDPDKLPGQVVNASTLPSAWRVTAEEVAYWKDSRFGGRPLSAAGTTTYRMTSDTPTYSNVPRGGPVIYKPAHGGYPGEVKAR